MEAQPPVANPVAYGEKFGIQGLTQASAHVVTAVVLELLARRASRKSEMEGWQIQRTFRAFLRREHEDVEEKEQANVASTRQSQTRYAKRSTREKRH